jgi:hypothetical protein
MITRQYEQQQPLPIVWTWFGLILTACLLIGWGVLLEHVIPTSPRYWDFDTYIDIPAESMFSTFLPPEGVPVPPQIHLPPNRVNPTARIE